MLSKESSGEGKDEKRNGERGEANRRGCHRGS